MGLNRVRNTKHGNKRASERMTMYKKDRLALIKQASKHGLKWTNLDDGPLKDYVRSKGEYKRVRYYQGYIFIFQRTSTSLITMYPVDPDILVAQTNYNLEEINNENNIGV